MTNLPRPLLAAPGAGVPDVAPARLDEWFDPADLRRARRYRRGTWALGAAGVATGPLIIGAVAAGGRRWRGPLARAAGQRAVPAALLFGAGLAALGDAVSLPGGLAGYGWGRAHGLVTQSLGSWMADRAKASALGGAFTVALAGVTAVAMRKRPVGWWLPVWGAAVVGSTVLTVAGPKVIEPLFQKTRPLDDAELERDVRDVAERVGVPVGAVVVNDASARTTGANAYVSGIGPTRRVVLFDTLLRDFPPEQVRFVVAHELAHVARRHITRGSLVAAFASLPGLAAVGAAVTAVTGRRAIGAGDADLMLRRLTVAMAGVTVAGVAARRWALGMSRGFEREADWEALRATGDPAAAIALHRGLVQKNLGVPDPPSWVQRLLGSHPTALERIGLALRAGR